MRRYRTAVLVATMVAALAPPASASHAERPGRAARFGPDDVLSVPHAGALGLTPVASFTVEAWVRPRAMPSDRCQIVAFKGFGGWGLFLCQGKVVFRSGGVLTGSLTVLPLNEWTHVAASWIPGTGQRLIHLNGSVDHEAAHGPGPEANTDPVTIGGDLDGELAELRLWNVARNGAELRRTMHRRIDEPATRLVASWNLDGASLRDGAGGHDATVRAGALQISDLPSPAQRLRGSVHDIATADVRRAAATAQTGPDSIVAAGGLIGTATDRIVHVDLASGRSTLSGRRLPSALAYSGAAYVPDPRMFYVLGGQDRHLGPSDAVVSDAIIGFDPEDPLSQPTVVARLPRPVAAAAAAYHPRVRRVFLFGGTGPTDAIVSFDPATGATETLPVRLPSPRYLSAAAYSPMTDRIYVFGGGPERDVQDDVLSFEIRPDGSAAVAEVAVLPDLRHGASAVSDPDNGLVHIVGGLPNLNDTRAVVTFDPATRESWQTPVRLPEPRALMSAGYSSSRRSVVVAGGTDLSNTNSSHVTSLPLGDGPVLGLGEWSQARPAGDPVTSIDGDDAKVVVGSEAGGATVYGRDRTGLGYPALASTPVDDVRYEAARNTAWIATRTAGVKRDDGADRSIDLSHAPGGQNEVRALEVERSRTDPEEAGIYGTRDGLWYRRCLFIFAFKSCSDQQAMAGRRIDALEQRLGPAFPTPGPVMADLWALAAGQLWDPFGTNGNPVAYGAPCGLAYPDGDMAFDRNGDLWLATRGQLSDGFVDGAGVCQVFADAAGNPSGSVARTPRTTPRPFPTATPPGATPSPTPRPTPAVGVRGSGVDVDRDGRIWTSFEGEADVDRVATGGLGQYQVRHAPSDPAGTFVGWVDGDAGPVSTNGILRSNDSATAPKHRKWDASLSAVAAVDEKVWAGGPDGRLITYARRWRQLLDEGDMRSRAVEHIWMVRGRAFLATSTGLHVLMPDGRTWDDRDGVHVREVFGDRSGRIWVGTDDGVRIYTPDGWDLLDGRSGDAPSGPVHAIVQDGDGRIWIGGDEGLTLFDDNRWVLRHDRDPLPATKVTALHVDADGNVLVGTSGGLAKLNAALTDWTALPSGLPDPSVHDIAQLGDGRLAVATGDGVAFFDGTTFTRQQLPVPDDDLHLAVDGEGTLWAGGAVYHGGVWEGFHWTNSGLASSHVNGIAADGADRVWFVHGPDHGVSVRGEYLPPLTTRLPTIRSVGPVCDGAASGPACGTAGDTLVISGDGFGGSQAAVKVLVGDAEAEVRSVRDDEIRVKLRPENTSGAVAVSVGGGGFFGFDRAGAPAFCAIPQITGVTPTGGVDGTEVVITGGNLDRSATVQLGGAARPIAANRTQARTTVRSTDGTGAVIVRNVTAGCGSVNAVDTTSVGPGVRMEFRRIGVSFEHFSMNQNVASMGLVAGRQTLVSSFLMLDPAPRPTDVTTVDEIEITFTEPDGTSRTVKRSGERQIPRLRAPWNPDYTKDISNALNAYAVYEGHAGRTSDVPTEVVLRNRTAELGRRSKTVQIGANVRLGVVLVPIMRNDWTLADYEQVKRETDAAIRPLVARWPTGSLELQWSHLVFTADDVLHSEESTIEIGDGGELFEASHELAEARAFHNERDERHPYLVAFGVVDGLDKDGDGTPEVLEPSDAAGLAFRPDDNEEWAWAAGLGDGLCDIGAFVGRFFGGTDECELDMPMHIGWAGHLAGLGTFAQEIGHTMDLVEEDTPTHDDDNSGHSLYDEVAGGYAVDNCAAPYARGLSFYASRGVSGPVVNTAGLPASISPDEQLREAASPTPGSQHAKTIMSYACGDVGVNMFYEPMDLSFLQEEYPSNLQRGLFTASASFDRIGAAPAPLASAAAVPGPRLHLTGTVDRAADAGDIVRTAPLGETAPPSPSYARGWTVVQLDASGAELARTGVLPRFGRGGPDLGAFSATIVLRPDVARVELRHDSKVLDTLAPGAGEPEVRVTAPSGGSFDTTVPVSWTASDPDGDPLVAVVRYSSDDGATWDTVKRGQGSGSTEIPSGLLAGGPRSRIAVEVSDGLHTASAMSGAFAVPAQPPIVTISAPVAGAKVREGAQLVLTGGASDAGDDTVPDDGLRWRSDRDGELGTGSEVPVALSVGSHTITVEARNSRGVTASDSVRIEVLGDYDGDGLTDAEEQRDGLNALAAADAFSDGDADGLTLVAERRNGTHPARADTDGDGRTDLAELGDGTAPAASDDAPPPDELVVSPSPLLFDVDASARTFFLPQQRVAVYSREPAGWTVTSDRPWLVPVERSGTTPDGVSVAVLAYELTDGTHRGTLTFSSSELGTSVEVPVTALVRNASGYYDATGDGRIDVGDVQTVAGRIPAAIGDDPFVRADDLDRDTDIDAGDAALAAGRWTLARTCCDASMPASDTAVSLAAPDRVRTGEPFTVDVVASGASDLGGFETDVVFDTAVLRFDRAEAGTMLASGGRTHGALGPVAEDAGRVAVGGYSHGSPPGASGDGTLARLTFTALAPSSTSEIRTADVLLASSSGPASRAADATARVTVEGPAVAFDADLQAIAAPGTVKPGERRPVKAQVVNRGEAAATIGVRIDAVPPGGASNPYGCAPAGRLVSKDVTLDAGEGAPVFAGDGVTFSCEDAAGASGKTFTIVAAADANADDADACPPGALRSDECRAALADDDSQPANDVRSKACCTVQPPPGRR